MAFKLKDFDFKKFMLERGEQVGLGVAVAIASLMVVFGLFIPAFSTKSAGANAGDLNTQSQQKKQQMENAAPSAEERVALASWDKRLRTDRKTDAEDPDTFRVAGAGWFNPSAIDDTKRRAPVVKVPREFRSTVELAQVQTYLVNFRDGKPETILVLEGTPPASGRPGGGHPGQSFFGAGGAGPRGGSGGGPQGGMSPSMPPGGGGLPGGSSAGGPPGGGMMMPPGGGGDGRGGSGRPGGGMMMPPGGGFGGQELADTKAKITRVKVDELDAFLQKNAKSNARLAEDVLPLRMVVVTGSFPYKEQLEEFKSALHYPSIEALFADRQSTPEFLPFTVERRELKPDGTFTGWQKLDLARSMRPVVLMTGRRYEPEDPALEAVSFDGLVMHRPLQYKDNQADHIDLDLKLVKETRDEIKDALASKVVKPRNPFQDADTIDPFNPRQGDQMVAAGGAVPPGVMSPSMPPGAPNSPKPGGGGKPQLGAGGPAMEGPTSSGMSAGAAGVIPKYCLVRFLDVTVEPGKTYGYRMQIRMTNPNKDRKDVAWASLAKEDDIRSEWIEVKDESKAKDQDRIYVQPEAFAYAIDQALVTPKDYNGNRTPAKPDQVVMQVHRWLDYVFPDYPEKATGFPVGEWSIGERMLINRGEFIGRTEQVEMPRRLVMEERFGMAVHKKNKKIPVIFSLDSGYGDTLLVDFQGGKMSHTRPAVTEDGKSTTVDDKAPIEVLLMAPNGRLLVRDSVTDAADEEREKRYKAWKERLKEVKENKPGTPKPAGPAGPAGGNPFGGS